jgi:hypothetical protein
VAELDRIEFVNTWNVFVVPLDLLTITIKETWHGVKLGVPQLIKEETLLEEPVNAISVHLYVESICKRSPLSCANFSCPHATESETLQSLLKASARRNHKKTE